MSTPFRFVAIQRALARSVKSAWPDVGPISLITPVAEVDPPCAAVLMGPHAVTGQPSEPIQVLSSGPRVMQLSYTITVYGRFPIGDITSVADAKQDRLNDLYEALANQFGQIYDDADPPVAIANVLRLESANPHDYLEPGERFYDVAMTVSCQSTESRY